MSVSRVKLRVTRGARNFLMSGLNTRGGNKVALIYGQHYCKEMFLEGLWTGRVCSMGQGASGTLWALCCWGSVCAPGQTPLPFSPWQSAKSPILGTGNTLTCTAFLGLQAGENRLWLREVCKGSSAEENLGGRAVGGVEAIPFWDVLLPLQQDLSCGCLKGEFQLLKGISVQLRGSNWLIT